MQIIDFLQIILSGIKIKVTAILMKTYIYKVLCLRCLIVTISSFTALIFLTKDGIVERFFCQTFLTD